MTLTPLETLELAARRTAEKIGGNFNKLMLLTFAFELWKLQHDQEKSAYDLQVSRHTDEIKA